jgi:ribosomal protein S18 acetylase RimI-like enzyme
MPPTPVPPPASDPVVRVVRPDEHDVVGDLTVAGYDADGHLVRDDGTYDHEYAAWIGDVAGRADDSTVLVATDGDRIVGTVTWCPYGSAFAQLAREPHQGELRTLAVDPRARGRGVGRALVEECVERARRAGLAEVVLCSLTEMAPAHRLYLAMGFVRRPDLDWSPLPGVRLWGFALDLPPGGPRG